ncbi:MAG TPA: hypothetical protein VI977_03070 [archaeon]|nr:hypothetical protein [archaeon]
MNKKILVVFSIIALALLLAGCTQQPQNCGNATCDSGETFQNCPNDCPEGNIPMPDNATGTELPPELPF